jgi:peptide deformylase
MKPAKISVLITGMIALLVTSCKTMQPFAETEKSFIVSGTAETPFRILLVTNKQDSILLRKPCDDLKNFANDSTFHLLIIRLKKTLDVERGVGITASQVGISKNLFLFMRLDLPDKPIRVAVNPKIVNHPDTTVCFERDGCLSIPDFSGNSIRYPWIDVEYQNEKGKKIRERLEGYSRQNTFTAIIFQHEHDHTKGILFTDKLCK